jgi:hypothetical protein
MKCTALIFQGYIFFFVDRNFDVRERRKLLIKGFDLDEVFILRLQHNTNHEQHHYR